MIIIGLPEPKETRTAPSVDASKNCCRLSGRGLLGLIWIPPTYTVTQLYSPKNISLQIFLQTRKCLKVTSGQIGSAWEWYHWIYRPWKGHQPLKVFDFLISVLNIWKEFKVLSRFIQKIIQPPACSDHGLYRILSAYWLVHFYLLKKSARGLHYLDRIAGCLNS